MFQAQKRFTTAQKKAMSKAYCTHVLTLEEVAYLMRRRFNLRISHETVRQCLLSMGRTMRVRGKCRAREA